RSSALVTGEDISLVEFVFFYIDRSVTFWATNHKQILVRVRECRSRSANCANNPFLTRATAATTTEWITQAAELLHRSIADRKPLFLRELGLPGLFLRPQMSLSCGGRARRPAASSRDRRACGPGWKRVAEAPHGAARSPSLRILPHPEWQRTSHPLYPH